jgi:predicted ATPase/DNA-binding CsgD family transcriptional regulator
MNDGDRPLRSQPQHGPSVPVPLRPAARRSHLLAIPSPLTSFVGREREIEAVCALLAGAAVRLVTLTGPGGVGKTRLALRVAERAAPGFPDGVWFVQLAPVRHPELVATAIAEALGHPIVGDRPVGDLIASYLRERRALLVLDNFEHLLDAGPLVVDLLQRCPKLKILVTSRSVLRISGEHGFDVPPLGLPNPERPLSLDQLLENAATRLFIERATAARSDFAATSADAPAIATICRRLDGLPLAIELAAARVGSLPLPTMLARLERRLPLLTAGARDQPQRLRTMRDAIAWSHDLLSPGQQVLFRRLSVFVGGFTIEAAEAVCQGKRDRDQGPDQSTHADPGLPSATQEVPGPSVLDGIVSLAEKSLVRLEVGAGHEPRYQMLETIREFGVDELEAAGEREAVRNAHAAYFVRFAERADPGLGNRLEVVQSEHANIRAALTHLVDRDNAVGVLRLAGALSGFWQVRGHLREGKQWLEWALAHTPDQATPTRGRALCALGLLEWSQGDYAQAGSLAQQSLTIAQASNDTILEADALGLLGLTEEIQLRWNQAGPLYERALALRRDLGDRAAEATTLFLLSGVARGAGDVATATARGNAALALFRELRDAHGAASTLGYLAHVAQDRADDRAAALAYHEALALWSSVGDRWWIVKALAGLAGIAGVHGQPDVAATLVGAVDAALDAIGAAIFPFDRVNRNRAVIGARAALGEDQFADRYAAGRALPLEDAIAVAASVATPSVGSSRLSSLSAPASGSPLTAREHDVLRLLAKGMTDREIGAALFISHRTASTHVANILAKLDAPTRRTAVAQAREQGLLPDVDAASPYT